MIRLATPEDLPATTAMLGHAFRDEAMLRWSFADDGSGDFEGKVRTFFELYDREAQALGYLWVSEDLAAAAEWEPPGAYGLGEEIETRIWPAIAALTLDGGGQWEEFWAWADSHRPQEPHWYLNHVAVDEPHRGKGLAVALTELGLAFARADGTPAYLETSKAEKAGFYERRGFRVIADADAPGGGPHVWFMRFDPA